MEAVFVRRRAADLRQLQAQERIAPAVANFERLYKNHAVSIRGSGADPHDHERGEKKDER